MCSGWGTDAMGLRGTLRLMRGAAPPWLLGASLAGWVLMGALALQPERLGQLVALCSGATVRLDAQGEVLSGHGHGLVLWLAMLLAMQPLLVWPQLALLARANLPRLRAPAQAAFLAGHVLPWLALGLAQVVLTQPLPPAALTLALLPVLIWQAAPLRQRWLNACHRKPSLRAFGGAMLADTARYGLRSGLLCTAICGPVMLLAMRLPALHLPALHLPAMAALSLLLLAERNAPARPPAWRLPHPFTRPAPLPVRI
ncbi:DUF2182 domain-containing protein [Paracoccus sp. (in: a-proteobacteria)]|uniref:copper chaperone n=1 Tax=Paracoccus sp. TaxID=267 RepID=UPI00321F9BD1